MSILVGGLVNMGCEGNIFLKVLVGNICDLIEDRYPPSPCLVCVSQVLIAKSR